MSVTDTVSRETRGRIMSRVRSKDTKPELAVRGILWRRGFRYRIHDSTLPGTPDISNKRRGFAVFVDGCFWHGCPACYREPKTNVSFWRNKVSRNQTRREVVRAGLIAQGFRVVEIWEHEACDADVVAGRVGAALGWPDSLLARRARRPLCSFEPSPFGAPAAPPRIFMPSFDGIPCRNSGTVPASP